jgi:hypothetical protein
MSVRQLWWKARVPVLVALRRVRAQPTRGALVVVGVAAALATLVAVLGGSLAARDRALQRAVAALPAAERSLRVDAFGLPPGARYATADRAVRAALVPLSTRTLLRGEFLRRLRVGASYVQLGSVDRLGSTFTLRSGRLPRSCTPSRCEVLELGSGRVREWTAPGLRFVRVGVAGLAGETAFGDSVTAGAAPGGGRSLVLLAAGPAALDRLPALDGILRSYSWIAPLDPARLHLWQLSRLLREETEAQTGLARRGDVYELRGPDDAVLDARERGHVAASRIVLLGGELSALLLVFALVAAAGLRRGVANELRRLRQRGAGRLQLALMVVTEVGAITLAGAALGIALGSAALAGTVGSDVLPHALLTPFGLAVVGCAWLACIVALAAVAGLSRGEPQPVRRRLLDAAALGALAALAIALSRGALRPDTAASSGDAAILLLLPGLLCFLGGFAAARLFGPAVRLAERAARRGALALRLALLGLGRASSSGRTTATFVAVSLGLALFAVGYRSTLAADARDEAGFAVPLDFVVGEGPALVRPLEAASLARYERLAPGTRAYPVVRQSAAVAGEGASVLSPTVLGIPAAAIGRLAWRSDYSGASQRELARRLGADGPAGLVGARLPRGARSVSVDVRIVGVPVALRLDVQQRSGAVTSIDFGEGAAGRRRLRARLPAGSRQVVGLEIALATSEQLGLAHRSAEDTLSTSPEGSLQLGPLRADGMPVSDWRGWLAKGASSAGPVARGRERVSYAFPTGGTVRLRRRQATDGVPLRVVVSPAIADAAGPSRLLTLDFGGAEIPARIVGTAARFPAAEDQGDGFVVADESRLATALDADLPGTGTPGELWLSAAAGKQSVVARGLRRPQFAALAVDSRAERQHALAADPLAHGTAVLLELVAAVALVLTVAGFGVALASELRDERGELFDLEGQGVSPGTLRAQLRLRALGVLAYGLLGGAVLGAALSLLTVDVVRIAATTATPEPPLRFVPAWTAAGAVAAVVLAAAALLVELAAYVGFRAETPARASWSLE